MKSAPLDLAAREVLQRYYSWPRAVSVTALGNGGGFSGARLWRVDCRGGPLCLRAWPEVMAADALTYLHRLIAQANGCGLDFIPTIHAAVRGTTWIEHGGRLWELSSWQPGRADFLANPSLERLRAACAALARTHVAWSRFAGGCGVCPALLRRFARLREWRELIASGWRGPLQAPADEMLYPIACRAWTVLVRHIHCVPPLLQPRMSRETPLQPCLCDVWHDHLLFTGDTLTGLIDFGAVKMDHVAVDLARLLGSLVGDDREAWARGFVAYREFRSFTAEEELLAEALDRTGTILGAANWLVWLYRDRRVYEDVAGVARRLDALVTRMEKWN
jgi:hypothetical protein